MTISGGGKSGVFQVDRGVTASISGLTITDAHKQILRRRGGQRWHGEPHQLHHQRKLRSHGGGVYNVWSRRLSPTAPQRQLRRLRRRGGQLRHGDAHQLHHQRQLRILRRRGGQLRHGDAHPLHSQRKLRIHSAAGWTTMAGDAHRHDRRRQIGPSSAASDIDGTVTGSHDLIGTGGSGGLTNGKGGNIVLTSLTGLGLAPLAFYGGPDPDHGPAPPAARPSARAPPSAASAPISAVLAG